MHVQSVQEYCFSLSNMQICEIFVAVVVVVLSSLMRPLRRGKERYKFAYLTMKYASSARFNFCTFRYCTRPINYVK